jgi:hypothetical protein
MAVSTVPVAPGRDHHRAAGDRDPLARIRAISVILPENTQHLGLVGGAGGIRTLSTDCPVSKIGGPIRRVIVRLSVTRR